MVIIKPTNLDSTKEKKKKNLFSIYRYEGKINDKDY